jgi:Ca2+-binding RTX toxin-like protein
VLSGGAGTDDMRGGAGADTFHGGANPYDPSERLALVVDRVDYFGHASPVTVTTDGLDNDGAPGEHDNVFPDVEGIYGTLYDDTISSTALGSQLFGSYGNDNLTATNPDGGLALGGPGDDVLLGGTGPDLLDGVGGNDTVEGAAGHDDLRGNGGDDLLLARDGGPDDIDCDLGSDSALIDVGLESTVTACETFLP